MTAPGHRPMSEIRESLNAWATGTADSGHQTVLLADAAHLPAVLASGVADTAATIFVPGGGRTGPRLVGYEGSPEEPGAELCVGDDFYLQIQDYAASAFTSLLGPTLVVMTGAEDVELFLADAERARADGTFPEFAIAAPVRLAGTCALGAGPRADGPAARLYVTAGGDISTTPTGRGLGVIGASLAELEREWARHNTASAAPCAVCLGGVLPEPVRAALVAARPWLGRYLVAIEGLRTMAAHGVTGLRVSGFGGRLGPNLDDLDASTDHSGSTRPLLFWHADTGYVHEPGTRRTFRLGRRAAELAETLLVCGTAGARERVADADGLAQVAAFFATAGLDLATADLATAGLGAADLGADEPVAVGG